MNNYETDIRVITWTTSELFAREEYRKLKSLSREILIDIWSSKSDRYNINKMIWAGTIQANPMVYFILYDPIAEMISDVIHCSDFHFPTYEMFREYTKNVY